MRNLLLTILCIVACTSCALLRRQSAAYPGGKGWTPGNAEYGFEIVRDLFIPMDDGIVLEARVAYPTELATGRRSREKFPVLVEFTPYEQQGVERLRHTYLAEHGYIVALVHPRGSGKSTGVLEQFTSRDGLDGKAVVEWAAKLEGSNGTVGFFGASYPGALALATATKVGKDSPLKAVLAASIGMGAQYRQAWTNNGLPTILMQGYAKHARAAMGDNEGAERHFVDFEKRFWDGEAPAYDGDFWKDRLPLEWSRDIVANGIPVLQWGGWQDLNETGALRGYVAFQNALAGRDIHLPMAAGQHASPRYQLILGDWGHGIGMDIGVYLEWFDTWLKGKDTGLADTATPLHLFETGTGKWVNLGTYPVAHDSAVWQLGDGTLGLEPAASATVHLRWGKPDEAEGRLSFESNPISDGMTIAGPAALKLRVSSSNTNLEILARLYDIAPDGTAILVTKGALLGSMSRIDDSLSWKDAKGQPLWPWPRLDRDVYLTPGQENELLLSLEPIQHGLKPGHRLRLVLSTQSLGEQSGQGFLVADPSGLTAPQQKTIPGGQYSIQVGGANPSTLYLPEFQYGAFKAVRQGTTPTSWNELTRDFDRTGYTIPLEW